MTTQLDLNAADSGLVFSAYPGEEAWLSRGVVRCPEEHCAICFLISQRTVSKHALLLVSQPRYTGNSPDGYMDARQSIGSQCVVGGCSRNERCIRW